LVIVTQGLEKRMAGKAFMEKAPQDVVDATKQAYAEKKEQLATILRSIDELGV
jgi:valyl-tRNA synthetase